jgi:D-alanyl-lipoteichoic acid acyltransferase DltB (MBOAT superfamily)
MVFSSIPFLFFFLPVFLAGYFLTPSVRGKNLFTLFASLAFYAWGEPWFVLVLLASIAFNTLAAIAIDSCSGRARAVTLSVAVTANLMLLAGFKYTNFLFANLEVPLRQIGVALNAPDIPLPLGISFFTFHSLSYVIDVYRRRFPANRDPVQVALYIALFPQLVAGPIVRYKTVARQLSARRHTLAYASAGTRIFIIGLAQKVLIADPLAQLVEVVFDHTSYPSMAEAWTGLLAYSIQIYFDFAGYSNMAIGLGLVLGFTFPRNFRLPYTSLSITEFWRRWHMSLSAWLRDYLYIPLGGSRAGAVRTWRNLLTVFLLCGLWHGANWTFILWGAWHGGFLVFERLSLGFFQTRPPPVIRWTYTSLAVMGGWVLFRSRTLHEALVFYAGLVGAYGLDAMSIDLHAVLNASVLLPLLAGCALTVLPRWVRMPALAPRLIALTDTAWTFGLLILAMIFVAAGTYSPFLYFRF